MGDVTMAPPLVDTTLTDDVRTTTAGGLTFPLVMQKDDPTGAQVATQLQVLVSGTPTDLQVLVSGTPTLLQVLVTT